MVISEALANFFGTSGREMLQSEVLRRVWEYIKVNHLEVGGLYLFLAENVKVCDFIWGQSCLFVSCLSLGF